MSILNKLNKILDKLGEIDTNTEDLDGTVEDGNNDLETIATNTTDNETNTASMDTKLSTVNSNLASLETDVEATNTLLVTTNATLAAAGASLATIARDTGLENYIGYTSAYLTWNSSSTFYLSAGDFSVTHEFASIQNTETTNIVVTRFYFSYSGTPATWNRRGVFSSTGLSNDSYIRFGYGSINTAIQNRLADIDNNMDVSAHLLTNAAGNDPGGVAEEDVWCAAWDCHVPVAVNSYFVTELAGIFSAAGDHSFCAWVDYKVLS